VVTFDGFPLGYEVFAGNVHDARTLQTIVTTMEGMERPERHRHLAGNAKFADDAKRGRPILREP
jgi:hypothetical protein